VLIEGKDRSKYLLNRIPEFSPEMNSDSLFCEYTIEDNALKGKSSQYYMGESKQVIMSVMDATPKDKLNQAIEVFLSKNNSQDKIEDIKLKGNSSQSKEVEMEYFIMNKSGILNHNGEYYIDLERKKDFTDFIIDIDKRVNDIDFKYQYHIVSYIVLHIPAGYKVTYLPAPLDITDDSHIFKTEYKQEGDKIFYKKEITILADYLPKKRFKDWNNDILRLKKAYMEQLVLTKQ
jgi:hypothetical protein